MSKKFRCGRLERYNINHDHPSGALSPSKVAARLSHAHSHPLILVNGVVPLSIAFGTETPLCIAARHCQARRAERQTEKVIAANSAATETLALRVAASLTAFRLFGKKLQSEMIDEMHNQWRTPQG